MNSLGLYYMFQSLWFFSYYLFFVFFFFEQADTSLMMAEQGTNL